MKILMTGSHGFVGTNLIEAFSGRLEIIRWDVRKDIPLPECDAVIHLAGLAHDTMHTTEASEYFKVNTDLTKRIYDRFLRSSAQKFIFFSSIKAQDGDTPYAQSKKAAEDYILSNLDEHKQVVILRPGMIHGPGNKGNLNLLVKVIKSGMPWPLASFKNKRSFASIRNVCYLVEKMLSLDVPSDIYNVCDDDTVSTNELIEIICQCIGRKACMWQVPQGVMRGLAKIGDSLHLPLNTERLEKLTNSYIVDNSKIKHTLGIETLPINAIDGLKQSIQSVIIENGNG